MTATPIKAPERLLAELENLNIQSRTITHEAVMTVEDNQAQRGAIPGRHSKNLFLKDKKKQLWLVVADENCPIDLKHLRRLLGVSNLSFAKADALLGTLGVLPGSVSPFAVINDLDQHVRVVLDKNLTGSGPVSFHPLVNTMTTTITGDDLLIFLRATSHEPLVIDFANDGENT